MKAYKVVIGHEEDFYGKATDIEKAQYFFNKEDAEKLMKEGEYTYKVTAIYETYKDGTVERFTTGATYYEKEKKYARTNQRVELEEVKDNHYRLEEIEIN